MDPPADSRLFALKVLARAADPTEQAKAIVEHGIPYRVAASVISQMTPPVLAALIDRMSPQEAINNLGALKKRGVLDHPNLKPLVEAKLAAAKADGRVSAYKAQVAAEAAGATGDVAKALADVTDVIRDRFSKPQRDAVVRLVWRVVEADGAVEEWEESFSDHIARALCLSAEEARAARAPSG